MHVLEEFSAYRKNMPLFVTLPKTFIEDWKNLCQEYAFDIPHQVIEGGETRFHSVRNALNHVPGNSWVAIHDGVRPVIRKSLIDLCFKEAISHGNAIPVIPVNESLRVVDGLQSEIFDRSRVRIIQTPQVFPSDLIKKAYNTDYRIGFTDDATVFESYGERIHLVEGNPENIKITNPVDLMFAETLIKKNT